jgi:phasin family protein
MSSDFPNPFAPEAFSKAMEQAKTATEEFSKMFGKIPQTPNAEALVTAHQRNMAALSAANRIALEGAQAVAKRHMEIMQQTMGELTESMRAMATPAAPQAKAAQQTELLKRTYEHAVTNTRELSDLIQRSNAEALELLNKRIAEAMDEVKGLVDKT